MPAIQKCSIYGCRSNSRDHKGLRFFFFPPRDNPLYEEWLSQSQESAEKIRGLSKPVACSKHFAVQSDRCKLLPKGTLPTLFLKATPEFNEEERLRLEEEANRPRIKKLLDQVVLEWIKRARHYPGSAQSCASWNEIYRVGNRTRDLLGANLYLQTEVHWLRKFRGANLPQINKKDPESANKNLNLKTIIKELAPDVKILSEGEIAVSRRKENEQLLEKQKKRQAAAELREAKRSRRSGLKFGTNENSSSDCCEVTSQDVLERSLDCGEGSFRKAEQIVKDELIIVSEQHLNSEQIYPLRIFPADFSGHLRQNPKDDESASEVCERVNSSDIMDPIEASLNDNDSAAEDDRGRGEIMKDEVIIESFDQALEYLKPLEDFALQQENYRLIGALTTIEVLLKDLKKG